MLTYPSKVENEVKTKPRHILSSSLTQNIINKLNIGCSPRTALVIP